MEEVVGASSRSIDSSNIGFQLLKKQGWKEGTGLGIAEQGRLEPLQPHVKNNKRGLGAEKIKKKCVNLPEDSSKEHSNNGHMESRKKSKAFSKRIRKLQEEEKRMQEKEFDRAFFREFWPDNV